MKITSDTHVHSTFSFDGRNSLEEMVMSAIAKNLTVIGFTEHVDFNSCDGGLDYYNYEGYTTEIERIRDGYGDKILILKGIEFSDPHLNLKEFERELARDYDMIMVGLHWFDHLFYGDSRLHQKYSKNEIFEHYFNDLRNVVEVGRFDVLAHFDLPTRYLGDVELAPKVLNPIMDLLLKNKITPEINSSRFRNGYKKTMPDLNVLKAYKRFGGHRITFGSDAHSVEVIGADFDKTIDYLNDILDELEYGIFVKRSFQQLSFE
jgi:histidinol-phosphatase (PHP family)